VRKTSVMTNRSQYKKPIVSTVQPSSCQARPIRLFYTPRLANAKAAHVNCIADRTHVQPLATDDWADHEMGLTHEANAFAPVILESFHVMPSIRPLFAEAAESGGKKQPSHLRGEFITRIMRPTNAGSARTIGVCRQCQRHRCVHDHYAIIRESR